MKFLVNQTTGAEPPCENAKEEPYTRIDVRTVSDPSLLGSEWARNDWYKRGTNHRTEDDLIKRDFDACGWMIELSTLEDIMAFIAKNGRIIMSPSDDNPSLSQIEIYNDYRE